MARRRRSCLWEILKGLFERILALASTFLVLTAEWFWPFSLASRRNRRPLRLRLHLPRLRQMTLPRFLRASVWVSSGYQLLLGCKGLPFVGLLHYRRISSSRRAWLCQTTFSDSRSQLMQNKVNEPQEQLSWCPKVNPRS